jgi:NAD(P)H-hydrate epimerase
MKRNYVVSAIQMKELDYTTIEKKGITSFRLMKHAGTCLTEYILKENMIQKDNQILIVAGTGNNGGDALVISSVLNHKGYNIEVVLVGSEEIQSEESKVIWDEIKNTDIKYGNVTDIDSLDSVIHHFVEADIIIDGLFGIGITRPIEGYRQGIISMINQSKASVISIDLPSGLNADNGLVYGSAVKAAHTLIVQHYKQGNILGDARDYSGTMHLVDVGIVSPTSNLKYLLPKNTIKGAISTRKHNTHKYDYGCVLTVGGSKGMMGAPILSAISALKTGSGLSRVLYHDKYSQYIQNPYPTLMVDTYEDIMEYNMAKVTAIVFGPGLGRNDTYNVELLEQLLETNIPVVIDADGIYYYKQIAKNILQNYETIITPHYGEMGMLLNLPSKTIASDPVKYAKEVAKEFGVTVLLKGTATIITNGEELCFSNYGNPGMATAGSGDVLSGVIGSLLGRGHDSLASCKVGVLIHCEAAEIAKEEVGEESLIATDIIECIHKVLQD